MFRKLIEYFQKKMWEKAGKPMITYTGFNCGLCGVWVKDTFSIPTYKSYNEWWDTWGMCQKCASGDTEKSYDVK